MNTLEQHPQLLYETAHSVLLKRKNSPCTYKEIKPVADQQKAVKILQKEFLLMSEIQNTHILNPVQIDSRHVILFEDEAVFSLNPQQNSWHKNLSLFFEIAIRILQAVDTIHNLGIVLINLNTTTILLTAENNPKLSNFELATPESKPLSDISPDFTPFEKKYIAPELLSTPKIVIDHRCDIYSLGIIFSELLPQTETNIPQSLSLIVKKMIHPLPQFRYQSIHGILADIKACQSQYNEHQTISFFLPGGFDKPEKLLLGTELYGRETEIETLSEAIAPCRLNQLQIALIYGESGIGKTDLVNYCLPFFEKENFQIIRFKSNPDTQKVPFLAFRTMVSHYLQTQSKTHLNLYTELKNRLSSFIGSSGQMLMSLIPELAKILDIQDLPDFSIEDYKNRFTMVTNQFLIEFLSVTEPIVLFFDDVQWLDDESLLSFYHILEQIKNKKISLIFAFRTDSPHRVDLIHYFDLFDPIKIHVPSLQVDTVNEFISETLRIDPSLTQQLAELIHHKTAGNPFYVIQMIQSLYSKKALYFDNQKRNWAWDLSIVQQENIAENFVQMLEKAIDTLEQNTEFLLKIAAHIGSKFDLDTLATVAQQSKLHITLYLWSAIHHHYIICVNPDESNDFSQIESLNAEYYFSHDKLRTIFLNRCTNQESIKIHSMIGLFMMKTLSRETQEIHIFTMANHLNTARKSIPASLYSAVMGINIRAGKKANIAIAYASAAKYFKYAHWFLKKLDLTTPKKMKFEIQLSLAENLFLSGKKRTAESLFRHLINNTSEQNQLIDIRFKQIQLYSAISHHQQAIQAGLAALKLLNIHYNYHQSRFSMFLDFIKTRWFCRSYFKENITALKPTNSPTVIQKMKIMSALLHSTYLFNTNLCARLALKGTRLSSKFGHCQYSGLALLAYSIIHGQLLKKNHYAYRIGKTAVALNEFYQNLSESPHILEVFATFIVHWVCPYHECLPYLEKSEKLSLETGNLLYLKISLANRIGLQILMGVPLKTIDLTLSTFSNPTNGSINWFWENNFVTKKLFISYLQKTDTKNVSGDFESESKDLLPANQLRTHELNLRFFLLFNSILFKNHELGQKAIAKFKQFIQHARGLYYYPEFFFLECLWILQTETQVINAHWTLYRNIKNLKQWASDCPDNFQGKLHLVLARQSEQKKNYSAAQQHYESAIYHFQTQQFLHYLALSYEYFANMKTQLNELTQAKTLLDQSIQIYTQWGALRKVSQLQVTHFK